MDIRNLYLRKLMQFYERKRSRLRSSVAMVLAVSMALSLCTTNVFALAAESGAKGERHKHNFTCRELICEEEHEDGEHTKECFAESGPWLCGLEEGEYHIHNHDGYDCWVMAKELDCKATKSDADKETEEGADEEEWTASGSNATRSNAKRSKTGGKRHVHTDECYKEVYECRPAQEIRLMTLRNGEIGTDLETAIENAISEGEGTLVLENDYEVSSLITIDKDLTIDLNGKTITYKSEESAAGESFLTVEGAELTIQDDSGEGKIIGNAEKLDALIRVQDGGTLTVEGGTFESRGIRALFSTGKSTVNMTGGKITNCGISESWGSGILVAGGSTFNMTGGEITGNTADYGAVAVSSSYANIGGQAEITENKGNHGGGISVYGTGQLTLGKGAVISGNTAILGGGIYAKDNSEIIVDSDIEIEGAVDSRAEAEITSNVAEQGGAVYGESPCIVKIEENVIVQGNVSKDGGTAVAGSGNFRGLEDNQEPEKLEGNFELTENVKYWNEYTINEPVVVNLNGNTITYAGNKDTVLFRVVEGGNLTIKDEVSNEMPAADKGISGQGGIVSSVSGLDCLIKVEEGGKLTIEGGTLKNTAGVHAVVAENGMVVMTGGNIKENGVYAQDKDRGSKGGGILLKASSSFEMSGGSIEGNKGGLGGGIYANNSTVTISGDATISENKAADCGGGICALGTSTVMVSGDTVISKNEAEGKTYQGSNKYGHWYYGGGGIFGEAGTTITLEENCQITENKSWATDPEGRGGGYNGGGSIFSLGSVYMKGGTVSSNYAKDSGGGIYSAGGESYFEMTGGIIEKNIADQDEGGGLRVDGKGLITEGIIEKNTTNTTFDWGGGGIFVNSWGELTVKNLLVTGNTAKGFGGGVGGCSTGDVQLFDLDGVAVYGNTAEGTGLTQRKGAKMDDHTVMETPAIKEVFETGYQDFYCAGVSTVHGDMLGEGNANWIGSYYGPAPGKDGGNKVFNLDVADWGVIEISGGSSKTANGWMALTARPTKTDIGKAEAQASVKIRNNSSTTHGGGIMSNGTLILGTETKGEEKGSLLISKVASNFPKDTSFEFTVMLSDDNGAPLTGDLPFKIFNSSESFDETDVIKEGSLNIENGKVTIQLENGQSLKIWKLPVGAKYTVTETGANVDYETKVEGDITAVKADNNNPVVIGGEGSIEGNQSSSITFTNTPYTGQLEISKTVVSSGELTEKNKTDKFTFTIKLTGKNGSLLEGTYPYTGSAEAGSEVPSDGNCTFKSGEAEITLTHGQKVTFSGIPAGTKYTVSEKPQNGYSPENGTGTATGEIEKDKMESVKVTNKVAATGSLEIGKTVIGAGNANDDKFTFEVKLTGKDGTPLTGSFLCVGSSTAEGVAPPQDQALILNEESGGIFTFTLMHGQKITVSGLPMETNYRVEEKPYDGYTPQIPGNAQGSITEENADIAVEFINHMDTGSLSIQKTVTGKEGDKAKLFTFTITLTKDGKPLSGTYLYSGSAEEGVTAPEPGSRTFDANGEAKISLAHGQKVTFSGIPAGTSYRVTEAEANQGGYETTETGTAGTVVKDGESTAKFVNNRPDTPEETTTETETEPTTEPETTETEPSTSETEPTTEPSTSETEPTTEPSTSETEPATEPSTTPEESSPTEEPTTPEETTPAESSPTEETTTPEETTPAESPENPTTPSRPSGGGGGGGGRDRDRNPSVTPETTPIPPEEVPLANIDPEDVPLAMMPSDSPDETTVILDENVPLFGLPKTGDRSVPAGALFGTMLLSLMAACGIHMKKRKEK